MVTFNYISANGDILPLTGGKNYKLAGIDGQTSVGSSLSSNVVGGTDGDDVNNVQANPRTMIIYIKITADVEKTKREILDVVKIKQRGKIYWKQEDRELEIQGIIEDVDMPRWTNDIILQITLHCEQPFWENVNYIVSQISEAVNLHYFTDMPDDMLYFPNEGIVIGEYDTTRTKTFHNSGDVAIGLEIEIVAFDTVTNPIIYDTNGNFFGCGYGTGSKQVVMQSGDIIKINTKKNEKTATLNGVSILGKIKPQSTWVQLSAGSNHFSINSDDESTSNMSFSLIYKQRYV